MAWADARSDTSDCSVEKIDVKFSSEFAVTIHADHPLSLAATRPDQAS